MNSEEKTANAKAIIPEDKQGLAAGSPTLISRGLRDLTGSLDSILIEMGKALRVDRSLEDVVGEMFENAKEILLAETYSLFVMDSRKGELKWSPSFADYMREPTLIKIGDGVAEVGHAHKRTGVGLVGTVAQTGQVVVVADTSKDSRFVVEVDGKGTTEARSIVAVPVRSKERCLGVIELINCVGPEGFSKRKLVLLEALAAFAAIAIENARDMTALEEIALTDAETGLRNGRFLRIQLVSEIHRCERFGHELSVIVIDPNVDFQEVPVGVWSSCLAEIGEAVRASCEYYYTAVRYDTRFAILLPNTSKDAACRVAVYLSKQFHDADWLRYGGTTVRLPACIGVVSFPNDVTTQDQLFRIAEETLSLVRRREYGGVAAANIGVVHLEKS